MARPLKLRREPINLNTCVQEVVGFIKEKCIVQKIHMKLSLQENLPCIIGDEQHLQRALLNVFINALNSMPHSGELAVTTYCQSQEQVAVMVEDTGVGIAEDELGKLFKPFEQTHSGIRAQGGTGLGLAISREYVRLMGGDITVTSHVGKGSIFHFSIQFEEGNIHDIE